MGIQTLTRDTPSLRSGHRAPDIGTGILGADLPGYAEFPGSPTGSPQIPELAYGLAQSRTRPTFPDSPAAQGRYTGG